MRKRNWQSLGRNNFFNWELSIVLILIKSRLNQLQMYFARTKFDINKTRCSLLNFNFVIVETFAKVITRLSGAIYLGIVIDLIHWNIDKKNDDYERDFLKFIWRIMRENMWVIYSLKYSIGTYTMQISV